MSARLRLAVFAAAAAATAALLAWGARGLLPFGHYPGPYGDQVVEVTEHSRHATNAVTTVVMDVRSVDTAGEELILLAAVVGVIMLLRLQRDESERRPGAGGARDAVPVSTPVRTVAAVLVGPATLLGLYVVAHGQLTPGGGFQGGVVLALPSVLIFLSARFRSYERLHVGVRWEIAQAVAVVAFLAVGFVGLGIDGAFLFNVLPKGVTGTLFSAGTIDVLNLIAGPAVATAIVLIAVELIEQVTEVRRR
jgi:multicomponent Na+:H+ antiporter subunit B